MRVFKYLLVLILLVLAGAGIWLWRLPAATAWQQVQPRMPAVGLSGIGGTLWDGHADGISVLGHDLGKIHWQVPKWPALTGTPGAEVRIDGGEVELAGRVERVAAGRYDVHELRFSVPAARLEALFGAGDVQLQGTLAGTLRHASFAGLDLRQLAGAARWSDVGVRTVRGELQLADLLGEFATQPDGTVVGTFEDDGSGALAVAGTLSLRLPAWEAQATLRARNDDPHTLELLHGVGQLQADGSTLVRAQGTLPGLR